MEQHLKVFVSSGEQEMELHLLTLGALAPAGGNARCAAVDLLLVKWIDHCEIKYRVFFLTRPPLKSLSVGR